MTADLRAQTCGGSKHRPMPLPSPYVAVWPFPSSSAPPVPFSLVRPGSPSCDRTPNARLVWHWHDTDYPETTPEVSPDHLFDCPSSLPVTSEPRAFLRHLLDDPRGKLGHEARRPVRRLLRAAHGHPPRDKRPRGPAGGRRASIPPRGPPRGKGILRGHSRAHGAPRAETPSAGEGERSAAICPRQQAVPPAEGGDPCRMRGHCGNTLWMDVARARPVMRRAGCQAQGMGLRGARQAGRPRQPRRAGAP